MMFVSEKWWNKITGFMMGALSASFILFLYGCNPDNVLPALESEGIPFDEVTLVPPRTNWGPGVVFHGRVDGNRIKILEVLCSNLFPSIKPTESDAAFTTVDKTSKLNFKLELTPLSKIIGEDKLSISFPTLAKESGYNFDPGRVFYTYYTLDQMWEEGDPVEVDKDCSNAIQLTKEDGTFEDQVWIITGATAYDGASYSFSNSTDLSGEVKTEFEKLIKAAIGAGYKKEVSGALTKITKDEYLYVLTAKPRLVKNWVRSTAVTDTAYVSIETEVVPEQVVNILEQ